MPRGSRFQREAELLALLNHPKIAAIYDVEGASGSRFLVLELVEGDTPADRLRRGPCPPAFPSINETDAVTDRPHRLDCALTRQSNCATLARA